MVAGNRNAYKIAMGKPKWKTVFGKIILNSVLKYYYMRILTRFN
jgi:hypothetical protein